MDKPVFGSDVGGYGVDALAVLARLTLDGDEKARLERDLGEILAFASELSSLSDGLPDTEELIPEADASFNVFNLGAPSSEYSRERLLSNAPAQSGGFITVPKTV